MFLIFINTEIVGNLKYISGLQPVASLKSELLRGCLLFLFLKERLFHGTPDRAAFETALVTSEKELAPD